MPFPYPIFMKVTLAKCKRKKWTGTCSMNGKNVKCIKDLILRTVLFWVITQSVVVICYRRLGTTYWCHLQVSRILTPADGIFGLL